MPEPIPYETALALIASQCRRLPSDEVEVAHALDRWTAGTTISPADLPPFDNAAMDGFALRMADLFTRPDAVLDVCGEQAAGAGRTEECEGAWEIMTGARLPACTDSVVPVEQSEVLVSDGHGRPLQVRLQPPSRLGQHVRRRGEDVARGQVLLPPATRIGPAQRMLLAGAGVCRIAVGAKPAVAVICTGRELVDDPAQPLRDGQIRNTNGVFLCDRLVQMGARVVSVETVGDQTAAFVDAVGRALAAGAQMIVSTGAVSMGRYDFVPDTLRSTGARIVFHKVRVRPGKPILFAQLDGGTHFFGLPGNPVSAATGLRFFVAPALRHLMGLPVERPWQFPLAEPLRVRAGWLHYLKASVQLHADGRLWVHPLPGQESFRIAPLTRANAWIAVTGSDETVVQGTPVTVHGAFGEAMTIDHAGVAGEG